jgi:PhnB protein
MRFSASLIPPFPHTAMPNRPEGYSTVSPYLVCADAQTVIDFLRAVFDAEPLRRYGRPDGSVMHAELRIGDSVVMLADATADWPAATAMLHVYVDDVDAVWQRALAAGAAPQQEPERRHGDPERRGGFADPAGNSWWIAAEVE